MLIVNTRGQSLLEVLNSVVSRARALHIVAGYVSPGGCELLRLRNLAGSVQVKLVVGRAVAEGLPRSTRAYLMVLDQEATRLGGGVRLASPPSHAKIYCVTVDESTDASIHAFVGSSNLTENGLRDWHECMVSTTGPDALAARDEAERLFSTGRPLAEARLTDQSLLHPLPGRARGIPLAPEPGASPTDLELRLSFLTRMGELGEASGLNWWHAGGRDRHPDEAYVPLRSADVRSGLVERVFGSSLPGTRFRAVFHDGTEMEMMLQGQQLVRLQNGETVRAAKQITSAGNTYEFGTWILRRILGIPYGQVVRLQDLIAYGRTDITFRRIGTDSNNNAIVFVDFSV